MKVKAKRIFAAAAAGTFALSAFAPQALAAETDVEVEDPGVLGTTDIADASADTAKKTTEPTAKDMENLIKIVKPKLDIPEAYTDFDWNYSAPTYYNAASWRFIWSDKDGNGRVRVTSDEKGNIESYSLSRYDRTRGVKLPHFTKEELAANAQNALKKLCPEAADSMKLVSSSASSFYSQSFTYYFVRYENGIVIPDDNATVWIDYITGEMTSLDCNYHYALAFDGQGDVSADAAKEKLVGEQKMILSYRLKTEYDENGEFTGRKAYLVYTPEKSYLSVDAANGTVYTERNTWTVDRDGGAGGGSLSNSKFNEAADSASSAPEYELSEEELAQLDVLNKLITREKAIDTVLNNKALYIEPDATAVEARLTKKNTYYYSPYYCAGKNADGDNGYIWNISFSSPYREAKEEEGYYRAYMHATVDAESGRLLSFETSIPDYAYYVNSVRTTELPKLVYTPEQADEIFRAFADTEIPDIMKNVRLSNTGSLVAINYEKATDATLPDIPVYRAASLSYTRVNEGVDFIYNSVNGAVDRVTGKVTRFSYDWYEDVAFESPSDAITPEQAYRSLLESGEFSLNYEINSDYTYKQYLADSKAGLVDLNDLYDTKTYSRLVWSDISNAPKTVSALTGKRLDYSGAPYEKETENAYTDVSGHWAAQSIGMLTDLGFRFNDDEDSTTFKPDAAITEKEFFELLGFFGKSPADSVPENGAEDKEISRTQAVKYVIDAAGYYKVAAMPDIFITDFADNSDLKREDVGFIAIARGMKLIQGEDTLFRPYESITRAEAVTLAVNFLKASE